MQNGAPVPTVAPMHPSASFSATIRVRIPDQPGSFARLAAAIGEAGGSLGAIDLVRSEKATKIRDVNVLADDEKHLDAIVDAVRSVDGVDVVNVSDRVFLAHLGGKLEVRPRSPLKTRDDLSMVYTPGVARISRAIADDPEKVWNLTIKRNTVAVVSDGTAVLGLGDIGPEGAMPVMEGKAVLFKEFAGVDAFPICLATKDPDEIVRTVELIAPAFGGINLEDISAPRCFEVERRLRERLDIPVFHDDQHGTAIVVLAALLNALAVVGKKIEDVRIVTTGCGAAGMAVTRTLQHAGATWIVGCDEGGALYRGREGLNPAKQEYAETTNPDNLRGTADELLAGADVFIGVSVPGAITVEGVRRMAPRAIVFAMANPNPEIDPEAIDGLAEVIATGRSDYPNQINNVLAFPGVFRGALDVRARTIDGEMEVAAARAIAAAIPADELSADYVIPSVFNRAVAPAVAAAVADAAERTGVARRAAPPAAALP
ncbi:MAG TPA: NAD-dependent malic enzyme [Gaiellaceae bacterium]|nr:NAD-dependent malic enzyme [Gaiellaceae bacterium]